MIKNFDDYYFDDKYNEELYHLHRSTDWSAINYGGRRDLLKEYERKFNEIINKSR